MNFFNPSLSSGNGWWNWGLNPSLTQKSYRFFAHANLRWVKEQGPLSLRCAAGQGWVWHRPGNWIDLELETGYATKVGRCAGRFADRLLEYLLVWESSNDERQWEWNQVCPTNIASNVANHCCSLVNWRKAIQLTTIRMHYVRRLRKWIYSKHNVNTVRWKNNLKYDRSSVKTM